MHKHMETDYLTEIIHPIFGRKCCVHISVVIVDLTAFMMQPIHYAKPVQLLSDETVEISKQNDENYSTSSKH